MFATDIPSSRYQLTESFFPRHHLHFTQASHFLFSLSLSLYFHSLLASTRQSHTGITDGEGERKADGHTSRAATETGGIEDVRKSFFFSREALPWNSKQWIETMKLFFYWTSFTHPANVEHCFQFGDTSFVHFLSLVTLYRFDCPSRDWSRRNLERALEESV